MWPIESFDKAALRIIDILAAENGLTIPELDRRLMDCGCDLLSPATLYRRILRLQENQIVLRHSRRCYLNPIWVKELARRAEQLQAAHKDIPIRMPDREGDALEFSAPSLRLLDPLWNLVILEIGRRSESGDFYGYNARAWYAIGMTESEVSLFRALQDQGIHTSLHYGCRSPLDEQGAALVDQVAGLNVRVKKQVPPMRNGHIFWAGDRYLVECVLPAPVQREFARVFDPVANADDLDGRSLSAVFDLKSRCRIRVVKSRKRATAARQELNLRFGA